MDLICEPDCVWRKNELCQRKRRIVWVDWVSLERVGQRTLVHDGPAGDVDGEGGRLHQGACERESTRSTIRKRGWRQMHRLPGVPEFPAPSDRRDQRSVLAQRTCLTKLADQVGGSGDPLKNGFP